MGSSLFLELNWLAIAVAAIAYFMIGGVWYSKMLFAKMWVSGSGVDLNNPASKKGTGAIMVLTLLLEFIICVGLAILIDRLGLISGAMSGIKLGLFTGVFFSSIVICISYLYQMKPKSLIFIDAGYHLAGQVAASIILCSW